MGAGLSCRRWQAKARVEKADPEVWGAQAAIDMSKVPDDIRAAFDAIDRGTRKVLANKNG